MSQLSAVLNQIDSGTMLLPEFQRGYVWNRDQVRGLMRSLYLGYPVGALLVWEAAADPGSMRGAASGTGGVKLLLLDGQQRITSLYGIVRGHEPAFFEGDASAFRGLRFHVEDETFEFYAPVKMHGDVRWIDVTSLFVDGLEKQITILNAEPSIGPRFADYIARLSRLRMILDRQFHQEKITGADQSVDAVVEIFNKVNSGGTKLSKGDLALAKICADWPEARATMRSHLGAWKISGYDFTLDWLLRNVNAVATGRAQFDALEILAPEEFAAALAETGQHIRTFLDAASGRLGLDHNRVLMGRYAFPVVSRFLHGNGGTFKDEAERDKMLFWYVQSALWGRFAGSTETVLTQDYEALGRGGIDGLITNLTRWRGGDLTIDGEDFTGFGRGSRFYPLLYLLTRALGARDFGTGRPPPSLQVHHIFPKTLLYKHGYDRSEVNAVANVCFLTPETSSAIGRRPAAGYLPEADAAYPGVLDSQWIPADRKLWRIENYRDFLAARRELLAASANAFLSELRDGTRAGTDALPRPAVAVDEPADDDRARQVGELIAELLRLGCAMPDVDAEISDPETSAVLAMAEAFWPAGLQPGMGRPVVLELDAGSDFARMAELGYQVFTSVDALRGFVARRTEENAA